MIVERKMNLSHFAISRVNTLENSAQIYQIYQSAYRLEADLIGVETFPPLERSVSDISSCENEFYAAIQNNSYLGIVEIEPQTVTDQPAVIASLAVSPNWARQGVGKLLVSFVLAEIKTVVVTTAEKNLPAIALYEQIKFIRTRTFETREGIQMVEMISSRIP